MSEFTVLGVMSGTSLDGIDLAVVSFTKEKKWSFELLVAETVPYSLFWQNKLSSSSLLTSQQLIAFDELYTSYLGKVIQEFLIAHATIEIDFISSHGHTVLHQPERGITYQIGNLPILATHLQKKVICDFRTADVARGGQGAPLVPGGEVHLFSQYKALVNLGGFANCTHLTKPAPLAYDICPINVVLNPLAQKLGFPFDDQGKLARSGQLNPSLLKCLNEINFYTTLPPKSLGIEWVNEYIQPLLNEFKDLKTVDLLHTFCLHFSEQIVRQLPKNGEVMVTGGGAYNRFLIQLIEQKTSCFISLPSDEIIAFKEAIIFAFLGVLRQLNEPNCLASVTGADRDHTSGKIVLP